jgi:CHAT domain-containing protein/tetratricopeptide (TPR) repeat protein
MIETMTPQFDCLQGSVFLRRADWVCEDDIAEAALALDEVRRQWGNDHPDVAARLSTLAGLHAEMANYAEAEPLYHQALAILERTVGENHPDCARGLHNLATLYHRMGRFSAAEPLYCRALEIYRQTRGKDHPDSAATLNNLAALLSAMGNYAAAEPLLRQVLAIRRCNLGKTDPHYALALNDLALLYQTIGRTAAARRLYRRALKIRRQALGENHPDCADSLHKLATLHHRNGDHVAAWLWYKRALKVQRRTLPKDHPEIARTLNNLALLCQVMGDYAAAELLCRRALWIQRRSLGRSHPERSATLHSLASLYHETGRYGAAKRGYRQALANLRAAVGEQHPHVGICLDSLARLHAASKPEAALSLMQQAAAIDDRMIGQIFAIGSESQRAAYLKNVRVSFDAFLSLVVGYLADSPAAVRAALEMVLRRKALEAEALAAQRDAILGGKYPQLEPRLRQLTALRARIAQATLAGGRTPADWTARKNRLEADLARQIPELNLEQRLRDTDCRSLAVALPEGSVLVEFVHFNVFDFKAVPARGQLQWQPARYLAFVLRAGEPDGLHLIDLGEAEGIDQRISAFRHEILRAAGDGPIRDMVRHPTEETQPARSSTGSSLHEAVFDRLVPALAGRTRLLLAPDGNLTRLPWEVLPARDGHHLIDDYRISYLGTGRDVLRFAAGVSAGQPTAPPLVVADPAFDLDTRRAGDEPMFSCPASAGPGQLPPGRRSRDLGAGYSFCRLPGTRVEGELVAGLLGVRPWLDSAAAEGRLKEHCRSPRILHLATHGFFLTDQRLDPGHDTQAQRPAGWQLGAPAERLTGPLPENPLLRSGLALAGANTWLRKGALPPEAEDGLLTAEDVTGLDLLGTELVVLSACDTGLGEVRSGEGVFGLRRAFVLAGASTVVMSLWKVADQPTQELMADFYRRILAGQPRADALRQAQLAMKAKDADPFSWGGFICQGNPGVLTQAQHSDVSGYPAGEEMITSN